MKLDMAGDNTNVEPPKGNENPLNYQAPHMPSEWQIYENNLSTTSIATIPPRNPMVENSFCWPIWEQPINHQNRAYCDVNFPSAEMLKGNMFLPSVSGMDPQNLSHLPVDSGFIERAARFSCFGGGNLVEMMNPFSIPDGMGLIQGKKGLLRGTSEAARKEAFENEKKSGNSNAESNEAEFSGRCVQEGSSSKGPGSKKRKRGTKGDNEAPLESIEKAVEAIEIKQNSDIKATSINRNGGKSGTPLSQGTDQPKEEYIHIRARRGQATNSHSLAERVRREKISERMKLLQDLVPGCSKVTGKAVMLDEIINYVQSLQRQVEFLSMKLAAVNPRLDFLTKDMLQNRGDMMPPLVMPFPPIHTSPPSLMQPNSCEIIPRPIISHHSATSSPQYDEKKKTNQSKYLNPNVYVAW